MIDLYDIIKTSESPINRGSVQDIIAIQKRWKSSQLHIIYTTVTDPSVQTSIQSHFILFYSKVENGVYNIRLL